MGLYSILKSQIQSTFFAHVPCLLLRHLHTSIPAYISFHTSTSVPCLPATPPALESTSTFHSLHYSAKSIAFLHFFPSLCYHRACLPTFSFFLYSQFEFHLFSPIILIFVFIVTDLATQWWL